MIKTAPLIAFVAAVLLFVSACQRIHLSTGKDQTGSGTSTASTQQAPPLDGDWTVTFVYKDNPHESSVTFSQKGKQLAGSGQDNDTGAAFFVSGTVDGNKVHFVKKYTDSDPSKQPVEYDGDLTYENDNDYKGWTMMGHYKATVSGQPVEDKFVAVNSAEQAAFQQQQQQPPPEPQQAQQPPPEQQQQQAPPAGPPASIAGTWRANYDYNFKRLDTRLFLKQHANQINGDGVDTNVSKEDTWFQVSKGWYNPPRVMIVCHYEKGKHSNVTRDIVIKGQIQPDGHIKGETQYGAEWNAYPVR